MSLNEKLEFLKTEIERLDHAIKNVMPQQDSFTIPKQRYVKCIYTDPGNNNHPYEGAVNFGSEVEFYKYIDSQRKLSRAKCIVDNDGNLQAYLSFVHDEQLGQKVFHGCSKASLTLYSWGTGIVECCSDDDLPFGKPFFTVDQGAEVAIYHHTPSISVISKQICLYARSKISLNYKGDFFGHKLGDGNFTLTIKIMKDSSTQFEKLAQMNDESRGVWKTTSVITTREFVPGSYTIVIEASIKAEAKDLIIRNGKLCIYLMQ